MLNRKIPSTIGTDGAPFAVLDIGQGKTACFIAQLKGQGGYCEAEVLGAAHQASLHVTPSGLLELEAEETLRRVICNAERMAGTRVKSAAVSIGGMSIASLKTRVELESAGLCIMDEDVTACLKTGADKVRQDPALTPLHIWSSLFELDGHQQIKDPRGLTGHLLSVDLSCFTAPQALLQNYRESLQRCEIQAAEFIAAPYAAGMAALLEDERELGVLLLDIGARTTSFAVFYGGILHMAGALPVGGAHLTQDIAAKFNISLPTAERLKIMHGSVMLEPGDEQRTHELPGLTPLDGPQTIPQCSLAEVLAGRLSALFADIKVELMQLGMPEAHIRRVVIAGGGSQLAGMTELAEACFDLRARLGRPLNAFGAPEAVCHGGFSVSAGLVTILAEQAVTTQPRDIAHIKMSRSALDKMAAPEALAAWQYGAKLESLSTWFRRHF